MSTQCLVCPLGHACPGPHLQPVKCPPGFAAAERGLAMCHECPAGMMHHCKLLLILKTPLRRMSLRRL